jgi:hypothetical protein
MEIVFNHFGSEDASSKRAPFKKAGSFMKVSRNVSQPFHLVHVPIEHRRWFQRVIVCLRKKSTSKRLPRKRP